MSLESYRKSIQEQREREERRFDDPPRRKPKATRTSRKKRRTGRIIVLVAIAAVLILAAVKNPSKTEAKAEIKNTLVEYANEKMLEHITDTDAPVAQVGSALGLMLAPTLLDYVVQTDVSDYIFFSTFRATVPVPEKQNLVSGIIVFGKVIPLKSDFREEMLEK